MFVLVVKTNTWCVGFYETQSTERTMIQGENPMSPLRRRWPGSATAGARKNMDRMAEIVPESNSRNLQQFLTHSKWGARQVIDQVAQEANNLLGDSQRNGLLIDESGFAKQGPMSVGVSRQWLGRLGKVDNG